MIVGFQLRKSPPTQPGTLFHKAANIQKRQVSPRQQVPLTPTLSASSFVEFCGTCSFWDCIQGSLQEVVTGTPKLPLCHANSSLLSAAAPLRSATVRRTPAVPPWYVQDSNAGMVFRHNYRRSRVGTAFRFVPAQEGAVYVIPTDCAPSTRIDGHRTVPPTRSPVGRDALPVNAPFDIPAREWTLQVLDLPEGVSRRLVKPWSRATYEMEIRGAST
jgi:hypothetical protein